MASAPSSSSPPTPTPTPTPTRILFGVNESSIRGYPHPSISSRTAFDWTLQKLIRSNAAGFYALFLHVQAPDEDGFDDMDSVYASPDDFKNKNEKQKIKGLYLLQYFVERSHQVGIKCEAWLKMGDPKVVICEEAKRVQPDLLVVGSRGLGPVQRY
ncbi:universal stress protein A-like protein [Curcuma longa]|uniref:universal stress protein A-like protein n=1 Tax=Curcuma longa TaxID=136217 RepID=UPI003D9F1B68